jgi:hypothetical protein
VRTILNCRVMLAGLALLATSGLAACSTSPTAGPGTVTTSRTPAASATTSPALPAAAAPTPSATPTGPAGVQNLVISSAVRSELTATFAAHLGIQTSDLAGDGPLPGDAYYAYDPATGTYWAYATFFESSMAPASVIAAIQEYGATGLFREAGAGSWQVTTISAEGTFCPALQFFPPAVLTAWALPTTPPAGQTC